MDLPAGLKQPGAAETQKLKKVDGVWVAAEMAEKYAETMKKARAGLAKIDFAAHKDKALKSIVAFEDALKIVDGAKDAGGLMQALQEAGEKLKEAAGPGGR